MTRLKTLVLLVVAAIALSGCDFDVYKLPLPGGTDLGDNPMEVTAEFRDVLDLVPKTSVKVNDVSVGQVTDIELHGQTAEVTMLLRSSTELPDNAVAQIRQTSLLGEKFVSLEPPTDTEPSTNRLADGDRIGLDRTGRNPEVEEVLGALSLLLNGGGVAQLQTINHELNLALEGREDSARSVLRQIEDFMGQLDAHKQDVVDAIDALNRLSESANQQMDSIDAALDELPSALTSLDQQRGDLVKMLKALNRLGDVGVRVIRESKAATIDTFQQLQPVISQLEASGDNFVKAFNVFLTYPFVDEVVGRDPQVARNLHMGDYTNLSIQMDIDATGGNDSSSPPPTLPSVPVDEACTTLKQVRKQIKKHFGDGPIPLDALLEYLASIKNLCDGAADAINKCTSKGDIAKIQKCLNKTLGVTLAKVTQDIVDSTCQVLGIPADQCPDLSGGGGGGGDGGGGGLPPLPPINLPRAAFGPLSDSRGPTSGPTVGQLMEAYDPALVSLLVPGMVTR